MSAAITPSSYGTRDPSSRVKGIVIVVALHVLIGYALVSGMARKGLDLIKKPLEAVAQSPLERAAALVWQQSPAPY